MSHYDPQRRKAADGLVGRGEELALVRSFLDGSAGEGGSFLLVGEPGVGKTVLLDCAAEAALKAGTRVLRGAGAEFEADVSYSGLHQLLLPLEPEFGTLGPVQHSALSVVLGFGAGPPPDRPAVSEAVLALLRLTAARRPSLVIVDDVQWLDRASADVLGFVARRLAGSHVGFLSASRPGTEGYFERAGLTEHELRPLDDEAATDLLQARFPDLVPRDRVRLVAEAQGNPLALLELAAEAGGLQPVAAPGAPSIVSPVRRLQTLFASRVAELPAPTGRLLLRAALAATGDPRILQSTGHGEPGPGDLAPAERAGLVRLDEHTRRVVFVHPLIRSAVVKRSTSNERRAAHRTLARLLEDQPERRAWHLAEASLEPDEQVAALLAEIARRVLQRGDAVGAVAALLRAAELSPSGADRSRRLAEAAYIGADVTGELRSTPQLLAAAHAADPGHNEALHAAVAASYMLLSGEGDIDTAHRLLVGALEAFPVRDSACDRVLTEAFQTLLLVCFYGGRAELWDAFYTAVERFASHVVLMSLCGDTYCDPVRTAGAALDSLDRLIDASDKEADPARIIWLGTAGIHVDRLPGLRTALWRVVRDGRQGGAVASAISALLLLGFDAFVTGRWEEAQQLVDEGVGLCETHGYELYALPGRYIRALLAAGRGDFEAVDALTDDFTRWAAPRGIRTAQMYAAHARALAALGRGDYEEAYQQTTAISPAGSFPYRVAIAVWVPMDLVEAAVGSNGHTEANAHVTAMREAGVAALSPRLALLSAGSAAMAASGSAATALFEEALAVPGADSWTFELARVRLAYGEHLRRTRAITASRVQLGAALDAFRRMGARPWATRAENELRATGRTRSRGGELGPDALTSRERQIAVLAASGLSNKQIGERLRLSARTVGAHLRHIFGKLQVSSRAALRDALGPSAAGPSDDEGTPREPYEN
ncbi:LuxR family transcriptional regulator [Streptomyces sp. NPDC001634]|uniref:LuxR family transcriptional regulator n=1 Tax=Streptomyces sp. NPDC001634 TaxID=3154390 RepID=UPI00332A564B